MEFRNAPTEVFGGQFVTFEAVVLDPDKNVVAAAVTKYSISPDDPTIATIDVTSGKFTAATVQKSAATPVTVTAKTVTPDGYNDAPPVSTQTTVRSRVTRVGLATQQVATPTTVTVRVGDSPVQLIASSVVAPGSQTVPAVVYSYSNSNTALGSIDATGKFTALAPTVAGTPVTITASAEGVTSNAVAITVLPAIVPTVVVIPKSVTLLVGQTFQLSAVGSPAGGTLVWDTPDKSIVDVTATGLISAKSPTAAGPPLFRITAKYTVGNTTVSDFAEIIVTVPAPIVSVTPKTLTLRIGDTPRLAASVTNPGPGTPSFIWSTTDATKVSVDASGLLNAKAVTNTPVRITATYTTGGASYFDFADVTVTAPITNPTISFTPAALTAPLAGSNQVNVLVTNPIPGGTLDLAVRDPALVLFSQSANDGVSARGSLTGRRSGSTFMDATYTAGGVVVRASAPITVPAGNSRVARIIVEPRDQQVTAPVGFTYRLRFLDAAGNATTPETAAEGGSILYSGVNEAVATITPSADLTTAQVVIKGPGQFEFGVVYSRGNDIVALDNTKLTVNAAGSAGNYGSLTISTNGNVRQLRVGETVLFQVVVRDVNNVIQTTGVTVSTDPGPDGTVLKVVRTGDASGYFYNMTGVAAGAVTLKATVMGASTSILITVIP